MNKISRDNFQQTLNAQHTFANKIQKSSAQFSLEKIAVIAHLPHFGEAVHTFLAVKFALT